MKHNVIVIGSGNHHNALGVIRSLGRTGLIINLITIGNKKKNYIASSKYVTNHHALASIDDLVPYLASISNLDYKTVIISCADVVTEYLNLYCDILADKFIIPGHPVKGRMLEMMDKTTMISMASRRGIVAPTVWNLPQDYHKVTFPCITKAYVSSHGAKADIVICKTKEELDSFLNNNGDRIFVQAFISKKEEVQFIGCSLNSGEEVIIPGMAKVLRSQPNTNTGFLEYGPISPSYLETVEKAKAYIKDCKYSGLFSIEFIRDQDDKLFFLEINFRNDGNAICVTEAGINLPLIWVMANLGEEYTKEIRQPNNVIVMPEFQDFKLVLQQKVSLLQWINDWRRTNAFMEYAKDDPRPFYQYFIDRFL